MPGYINEIGKFLLADCPNYTVNYNPEFIAKGDKVSFSMRNYPEWMFCYMAITSIGAIVVPLNSWWQGDELEYGITNSESKLFSFS